MRRDRLAVVQLAFEPQATQCGDEEPFQARNASCQPLSGCTGTATYMSVRDSTARPSAEIAP